MDEALQPINVQTGKQRLKSYSNNPFSLILAVLVGVSALLTVLTLVFIIGYILMKGIPNLNLDLFQLEYNSENVSMFPSIVYGLFGMLFFVNTLHWGFSMLAGAFTLAIMVLPVIMRTTEEALMSVPDMYREASFGLGAGKLRTIFVVILPSAVPGILSGIILSVGRIVGETAALMYTAGTVAELPASVMSSTRTLSVHMYTLSREGLYINQAYATAVVLLLIVLLINWISGRIARKIKKG